MLKLQIGQVENSIAESLEFKFKQRIESREKNESGRTKRASMGIYMN